MRARRPRSQGCRGVAPNFIKAPRWGLGRTGVRRSQGLAKAHNFDVGAAPRGRPGLRNYAVTTRAGTGACPYVRELRLAAFPPCGRDARAPGLAGALLRLYQSVPLGLRPHWRAALPGVAKAHNLVVGAAPRGRPGLAQPCGHNEGRHGGLPLRA